MTHHTLRHFFAASCIESDVDIPTIARRLGHEDGGTLAMRLYGHLYITDQWLTHGHCLGKASKRHKSKMLVISTLSNPI